MTDPTPRRAAPLLAAALVAASALAACAPSGEVICSDIGWSNSLDVELEGERREVDAVALVRVCVGADCARVDGAHPPESLEPPGSEASTASERADQVPSEAFEPGPEVAVTTLTGTDAGGGRWNVGPVFSGSDDTYVVWTYAEDGSLLHAVPVVPQWQRVGGSEECGGPHLGSATVDL